MPYCSVLSCRHQSKFNNLSRGGISYHRFPHDPYLREKWIDVTGRQNWMPTKLSTICSKHFDPKCFIVKQSGYRYILDTAVPTLNFVKFYVEKETKIREQPSSDGDTDDEKPASESSEMYIDVIKLEPNSRSDTTNTLSDSNADTKINTAKSNTYFNSDQYELTQKKAFDKRRLKRMLQSKIEVVRKQQLKIKQLQAKVNRLSKRYEIVLGELKQRKLEDIMMGIKRKKYVHKEPEVTAKPDELEEIEFVRV